MNIEFQNFGALKEAKIELAPLTLLCGANNTSKTYALYAIYGLLSAPIEWNFSEWHSLKLAEEGVSAIELDEFLSHHWTKLQNDIGDKFTQSLGRFFSTENDAFKASRISFRNELDAILPLIKEMVLERKIQSADGRNAFEISKLSGEFTLTITHIGKVPYMFVDGYLSDCIWDIIIQPWSGPRKILLPAERGGLNLFYPELNSRRTALFHEATNYKTGFGDLMRDATIARYPRPIANYIDLLNDMRILKRGKSSFHDLAMSLQKEVLGGNFNLDREATISFKPRRTKQSLGLHLSSSTAKSYFSLWFYLEHMAHVGDVLMIDEPELNLHPDNQRRIARIFARMVNRGIRIILSTHSDYLVREFNNLIVLGHEFPERNALRGKFAYSEDDVLNEKSVRAYCFGDSTIKEMEISPDEGIIAETFDSVINELNDSSYELASSWAEYRLQKINETPAE